MKKNNLDFARQKAKELLKPFTDKYGSGVVGYSARICGDRIQIVAYTAENVNFLPNTYAGFEVVKIITGNIFTDL